MLDAVFPITAFCLTLAITSRSLGLGLGTAIAFGYFNGVIRANFLSIYTTFMFDAGVLGFYAGAYFSQARRLTGLLSVPGADFVVFLVAWPTLVSLVPVNDLLVQFVALRGSIWFLPVLLIASRLTRADLTNIARVLAVMNLVALGGGIYVYFKGVEALYPVNAVTEIIYKSNDVAGYAYHRIPSTFLSAHAYGGTMLYSLPFLMDRLIGAGVEKGDRLLAAVGMTAAGAGILLCAARQPVVMFVIASLVTWACARFNAKFGIVALGVALLALVAAASNERLQRAATLEDSTMVSDRLRGSANDNFLELAVMYPAGAGMGSSVGTSIPFFLADRAPKQVGLENEYCRILIDQGWIGLAGWLVFLIWLFMVPPWVRLESRWSLGVAGMYGLIMPTWVMSFMGTGALTAIPQSVLMMLMMGVLLNNRNRTAAATQPQGAGHAIRV